MAALLVGENEHPNPDTPPASGGGQRKRLAPEACDVEQPPQALATNAHDDPARVSPMLTQQQRQQHTAGASPLVAKRQREAAAAAVAAIVQAAEAETESEDEDRQAEDDDEDEGAPAPGGQAAARGTGAQRQRKRRTRVLVDVHGGAGPGAAAAAAAGAARELRPEDVENEYERQVGGEPAGMQQLFPIRRPCMFCAAVDARPCAWALLCWQQMLAACMLRPACCLLGPGLLDAAAGAHPQE